MWLHWLVHVFFGFSLLTAGIAARSCTVSPLGQGKDDTDQVNILLSRHDIPIHLYMSRY